MPLNNRHILNSFNEALEALRNDVIMMSSLAERNFSQAVKSLLRRDSELAEASIRDDEEVDTLEKKIDSVGVSIILRFTPLASDLRRVIATMKLAGNLERISDESVSIARRAKLLNLRPELAESQLVEGVYQSVLSLYKDSLRAFMAGDLQLAYSIKPRDKQIDAEYKDLVRQLTEKMAEKTAAIPDLFNLTSVLRSLERVGDHATNIAEDAVYAESAEDIRHIGLAAQQAKAGHLSS
jgi:phosphate transport system protein